MRILIVSYEAWRDTNNGGNVLSNVFSAFPDADIAQIYCSGELPQNSVCRKYFQISDSMLLSRRGGRALEMKAYDADTSASEDVIDNKVKSSIPSLFKESALLMRELLWVLLPWKTEELEQFILDFKPDIIFAPCYYYFHVSMLALYVKSIANCLMISYISDDNYSLRQLRFSPSFFLNRLITRKWIRRHFSESCFVYTMTELQKKEYEALLNRPMKLLCKSADFSGGEKEVGSPVRFIYAGGLYLNRWKVLAKLAEAIGELNRTGVKAELHIYSGSQLSSGRIKKLNDGRNSFLHSAISYGELAEKYKSSDIAVHVESFDLKNSLITRLSFSTKIIDCMNSGCAVLAVGPSTQAGIAYLKDNDAALCVNDMKDLSRAVADLAGSEELIRQYAAKSIQLGKKNHRKEDIEKGLRQDFNDAVNGAYSSN